MSVGSPIPHDLSQRLGSQSPWMMSNALFARVQAAGKPSDPFREVEVSHLDPEWGFVMAYFNHQKPQNRSIRRIVCVHNPDLTHLFEANLKAMDKEAAKFPPNWPKEEPKALRAQAFNRWKAVSDPFTPLRVKSGSRDDVITDVRVVPLFHGTRNAGDICTSGFAFFGKHHLVKPGSAEAGPNVSTDIGYFGSGIYFTDSAQYAAMYESNTLILAWVGLRPPYPVVNDVPIPKKGSDMLKLQGQGAFQNYNGHFIPVASFDPKDPECMVYYPCHQEVPAWDEVVVFQKAQALPRFRLELEVELPRALAPPPLPPSQPPAPKPAILVTQNLLDHINTLLQTPSIIADAPLYQFLSAHIKRLEDLYPNADLSDLDQRLYTFTKQLLGAQDVIQKAIRDQLVPAAPVTPVPVVVAPVAAAVRPPEAVASSPDDLFLELFPQPKEEFTEETLWKAVMAGDVKSFKRHLEYKKNELFVKLIDRVSALELCKRAYYRLIPNLVQLVQAYFEVFRLSFGWEVQLKEQRDEYGAGALHYAVLLNDENLVQILSSYPNLLHMQTINTVGRYGAGGGYGKDAIFASETSIALFGHACVAPINLAVKKPRILLILMKAGATLWWVETNKWDEALYASLSSFEADTFITIIQAKLASNSSLQNSLHEIANHWPSDKVAKKRALRMCEALVKAGVKLDFKVQGLTAQQFARKKGAIELADYLQSKEPTCVVS